MIELQAFSNRENQVIEISQQTATNPIGEIAIPLIEKEAPFSSEPIASEIVTLIEPNAANAYSFWDNWYKIYEDEDEKADKKTREPLGSRQHAFLVAGCVNVIVLTEIFGVGLSVGNAVPGNEPAIAEGLTGGVMDYVKTWYGFVPEGTRMKHAARAIGVLSLAASLGMSYAVRYALPSDIRTSQPYHPLLLLNALPISDAGMAIFLKSDLNKLKLESKVAALFERFGLPISKKAAKILLLSTTGLIAMGLTQPSMTNNLIAAASSVVFKERMRKLIDMAWTKMGKIEDEKSKKAALVIAYTLLMTVAVPSLTYVFMQGSSNQQSISLKSVFNMIPMTLSIVSVDTLLRTVKQSIKAYAQAFKKTEEVEDGCMPKFKKIGIQSIKLTGILAVMTGVGTLVGKQMIVPNTGTQTQSPGMFAVIAQEGTALAKVGTKIVISRKVALSGTLLLTYAIASLYLFRGPLSIDRNSTPGYGTALFLTICFINLSLYLLKDKIRPPKKS